MADFSHVLDIDRENGAVEVEGGTTYERLVHATVRRGVLPTVAPELRDITVGGAIVGIGIESSSFRYGFVHDGLVDADVLLADGSVVTCTPANEYGDLFRALPNSYGTLGYVLRARLRLIAADRYVRLRVTRASSAGAFLDALQRATRDANDFVEGLIFGATEFLIICGQFAHAAGATMDIYAIEPYYRQLRRLEEAYLETEDYIFRYDPDWFWNVPEGGPYSLFRLIAPRSLRHSSFYKRYTNWKTRLAPFSARGGAPPAEEPLIQDWEVLWPFAAELIEQALTYVDLGGRPWAAVPLRPLTSPTLYPVAVNQLYFNLGCYTWARSAPGMEEFHHTRMLDAKCFRSGGIKMLYSSTFLEEAEFQRIYGGAPYLALKRKYDPQGRLPTLYQKVAGRG